jgi:glucosyl-3-phosphoglycerate synthase
LVAAKAGRRVSVVLPALDEEETVGAIVAAIVPLTTGPAPLVDELVVLDSGSTDRTAELAAAAGARVVHREDVLGEFAPLPGKGEVLWRSLAATTGDVVCFIDSDLVDFDAAFVPALDRAAAAGAGPGAGQGASTGRPLRPGDHAARHRGRARHRARRPPADRRAAPRAVGIVQPLGGEYAATRELLESVPFATGYGVEIGLLLDTEARLGLDAIGQVNLGVRKHRNRSLLQLGGMSRQIVAAALARCGATDSGGVLTQFRQVGGEWLPVSTTTPVAERPPLREVRAGYGMP